MKEQNPQIFQEMLGHAAEQRMLNKMSRLLERWKKNEPGELLFQLIFRSLGYTVNGGAFEELARLYSYSTLKSFFL